MKAYELYIGTTTQHGKKLNFWRTRKDVLTSICNRFGGATVHFMPCSGAYKYNDGHIGIEKTIHAEIWGEDIQEQVEAFCRELCNTYDQESIGLKVDGRVDFIS